MARALLKRAAAIGVELDQLTGGLTGLVDLIQIIAEAQLPAGDDGQTTFEGQSLREELQALAVRVHVLEEPPPAKKPAKAGDATPKP